MTVWHRRHGCLVSDIVLTIEDRDIFTASPAWKPMCEWVLFHGGNPDIVPVNAVITRDLERCRVILPVFVLDEQGRKQLDGSEVKVTTIALQGETPPMPWPVVLLEEEPTR